MTSFQKHVGVPAIIAVTAAVAIMALDDSFGPRPLVFPFKYGAIVVHVPWLLTLILIGCGGDFSGQACGSKFC